MKLALIGVGNAGSRIVNEILHQEQATGQDLSHGNILIINSSPPTFDSKDRIPDDRQLIIGDVHREIDVDEITGNPDLGAEVAREERHEINRALDAIGLNQVDGTLVVAGLAGGTGGGAGAVVLELLQAICDIPVYAAGVLPHEAEGPDRALAASRALHSFVDIADNVLAFDNNEWVDEEAADTTPAEPSVNMYHAANAAFSTRIFTLFAAGEFDANTTPENRVDPSDIIRILDTGGISSIGYAAIEIQPANSVESWLQALRVWLPWGPDGDEKEEPTPAAKINQLVRRAARSKLTLPCETESADRALILLSGPPRTLSRKGFEAGRYWLEREADIVDVMAGDIPLNRSTTLTAVVVYSNVTNVPRITRMQEQAESVISMPENEGIQFGMAASK